MEHAHPAHVQVQFAHAHRATCICATHACSHTCASMFACTCTRAGPGPHSGPGPGGRAGPGHPSALSCPPAGLRRPGLGAAAHALSARRPATVNAWQPGDPPFTPLARPHAQMAGDLASSPDTTCHQAPPLAKMLPLRGQGMTFCPQTPWTRGDRTAAGTYDFTFWQESEQKQSERPVAWLVPAQSTTSAHRTNPLRSPKHHHPRHTTALKSESLSCPGPHTQQGA